VADFATFSYWAFSRVTSRDRSKDNSSSDAFCDELLIYILGLRERKSIKASKLN